MAVPAPGAGPDADTCSRQSAAVSSARPRWRAKNQAGLSRSYSGYRMVPARVVSNVLLFLGKGVEQRDTRHAVEFPIVPGNLVLDRVGDLSCRVDSERRPRKPTEAHGNDPGFDRRQHQPGHDTHRHTAVADRRSDADLAHCLQGIQGCLPFRHRTVRQQNAVVDDLSWGPYYFVSWLGILTGTTRLRVVLAPSVGCAAGPTARGIW